MLYLFSLMSSTILLIIAALALLLGLDTYGSPDMSSKLLSVPVREVLEPTLLLLAGWRYWLFRQNKDWLTGKTKLKKLTLIFTLFVFALVALFTWYWSISHVNAVFELTRLHPQRLLLLGVLGLFTYLIMQNNSWWHKHAHRVILFSPFVIFALLFPVSLWPFNIFKELIKEDRAIENLQFVILALGGSYSAWASYRFWQAKQFWHGLIFSFVALGLLLVAGDEISWGQRLFGLSTPEKLSAINRQEELTFHNIYAIEWLVIYGYVGISLFGLFSRNLSELIKPLRKYSLYLPAQQLFGYFLFAAIFFVQQLRIEWGIWHSWSEPAELAIYTGISGWTYLTINEIKKKC